MENEIKIPTLKDLVSESELEKRYSDLQVLLNQEPQPKWIAQRKIGNQIVKYVPIERIEFLLTAIFKKWWVEVKEIKLLANSVCCTISLHVFNPVTKEIEVNYGVGASPIHTKAGAGAMDFNAVLADSVSKAVPHAKTEAIKDAAHLFGKIFGKDLNRAETINYANALMPSDSEKKKKEILKLCAKKRNEIDKEFLLDINRVIDNNETENFDKILNKLK